MLITELPPLDPLENSIGAKRTLAEIEYRAWTHDGKLRDASYEGLREVQDDATICQIK